MTADRKVNWAIVGLGDIVRKRSGRAILDQPDSVLRACVTGDPIAKEADIETLGPQKIYTNTDEMLADPDVDAVYLATPVFLHAPHAIAALQAGKDVLVEKPMAMNVAEAREMCLAADKAGRRLSVAYYRRFWPRFELVKDMLDRGGLGSVVAVRMALREWVSPAVGQAAAWRFIPRMSGGGVLLDVGSHRLDLLSWWFGLPRRLVARTETLTHDYPVEDSAAVLMILAGGAHFTGTFNWNSRVRGDEIQIIGTEAQMTLIPCDGPEVVIAAGSNVERRDMPKPSNLHYPLVDDFARAIIEDRPPRFSGADGMKATQIIEAIFKSSRENAWVEVG